MSWIAVEVSIPYRYATNTPKETVNYEVYVFQFLIGTLQTLTSSGWKKLISIVSIPYRYATNPKCLFTCDVGDEVSIPYRYATNSTMIAFAVVFALVSIPYRYATNVTRKDPVTVAVGCFNSL